MGIQLSHNRWQLIDMQLSCHQSPNFIKFTFRSREVRHLLLDFHPYWHSINQIDHSTFLRTVLAQASLLIFSFSVLLHSCCSHAQVFGKTLVHEFLISYSHTEWYLLFSDSETISAQKRTRFEMATLANALVTLYQLNWRTVGGVNWLTLCRECRRAVFWASYCSSCTPTVGAFLNFGE